MKQRRERGWISIIEISISFQNAGVFKYENKSTIIRELRKISSRKTNRKSQILIYK